jgi:hypothetical protein
VLFKDAPENIPPDLTATENWADKQSKKNDGFWKSQGIQ